MKENEIDIVNTYNIIIPVPRKNSEEKSEEIQQSNKRSLS